MKLTLAYRGQSRVATSPAGLAVALAPNLRRDRVSFDANLREPVLFREYAGALHDVVVSDLRYKPRDKAAYRGFAAERARREASIRQSAIKQARSAIEGNLPELLEPMPPGLERRFQGLRAKYWKARQQYSDYLCAHDPELWRLLVPCDPVVTVADDCLFFEGFSADESSYGCLTIDRHAFADERDVARGTTNVDYSSSLYEHFNAMRSYRQTRFLVDPTGFEVRNEGAADYREEKIDLPPSWLRGFLQLQSAMTLPSRRVPIGREGLYNILAYLKRHHASKSPRALRFELEPGRPPAVTLEPWMIRVQAGATPYEGLNAETIRVWGRDRLRLLARLLPVMDAAEVHLLGTGLPSFWSLRAGPLRFVLGLSGWTANDWSGGSAIDQIAPPVEPRSETIIGLARAFQLEPAVSLDRLRQLTGASAGEVVAGLNRLAMLGQVMHDLTAKVYRWRQVMPVTLSAEVVGPEHPETEAARQFVAGRLVKLKRNELRGDGLRVLEGKAPGAECSLVLDLDGKILRGKCSCSYFFTGGLRRGPCRHLQALRAAATAASSPRTTNDAWLAALGER
ncbi:hypothetical protein OJF2_56540 [Aquisphaera giovannonii]|uniref:SWIM-type domain-containing protein n=1 Tax=Aquisphaera giovannonii TaxID=406548 RepID=A0A5B9W9Z7_9BACT|nr:hypothetical protein [Aquisphaera giovannonii]QEH37069.1 hypothetical protein OJF2_56540 [Aquisphaera giovannonii]